MFDNANDRYQPYIGAVDQEGIKAKADALLGRYKTLKNAPYVTVTLEASLPVGDVDDGDLVSSLPHLGGGTTRISARGRTLAEAIEIIFSMIAMVEPLNYDDSETTPTEESPE